MATKPLPCPTVLRLLLRYNPTTGDIVWAQKPTILCSCYRCKRKLIGADAVGILDGYGYKVGSFFGRRIVAHRTAWAMVYGEWPNGQIDHINGNKTDNRIENLRCVPQIENLRNKPIQRNNTSGYPGVYLENGRWIVRIGGRKTRYYVGRYGTFEEAYAAKRDAERLNGFHENNGRRTA